ncbi:wax ester/triacylglycerol synthase family O-acyltransferase [Tamilnaduibacter salinus]|uniref:diacylglycerol O-acyltransferase n=1 Tax=Tamilnaduibacter salinus TaxID=1484056 RepID=A0A2A2I563_9GAMM|nr:wax ester/triacylglycerol synthase family O-acyltransferase [Tamilnaduibacter salinus]PAV26797.1 wax ester/triacylglycerol synthase family O-acyltransferase [Tamilnaduibacter salinus]
MSSSRSAMSSIDRAWLCMETPCSPMMIGAVLIFDRPMAVPRLKQVFRERLLRFHRFRQRVEQDGDGAWWVDDPYFDIDNHIHVTALPEPADEAALQSLASDLNSTPLDGRQPLWQVHYVSNYGAGCALIVRVHHCIADGLSLVRVLLTLTDDQPTPTLHAVSDSQTPPPQAKSGLGRHFRRLQQRFRDGKQQIQALLTNTREHRHYPLRLVQTVGDITLECAKLSLAPADPQTPLTGPLRGRKQVAWSPPLDLDMVKQVARGLNGTVNDVLMTVASGAIHDCLTQGNATPPACGIRVAVPFNLRPIDQPVEALGNQFGLVMVPLPVDVACPRMRFRQVQEQMSRIKRSWQAQVSYSLLDLFGRGPAMLERRALDLLSRKASAVLTNVPGPREPVYLAGAKLTQPHFWVPQTGGIGVGMSIFSYAGQVQFGLITDTNLGVDPTQLVSSFQTHFDQLREFAGPPQSYPEIDRRRAG